MKGGIKVAFYKDEILKELLVEEDYTAKQIEQFLYENENVTVLSDDRSISYNKAIKYKVISKKEKYIYRSGSGNNDYDLPNGISTVYEVEKIS